MVKKLMMTVCTLVLCAAVLGGCGGKDASSSQSTKPSPSPSASPQTSSRPEDSSLLDGSEFGGGMDENSGMTGDDLMPEGSALPDNGASYSGSSMRPTLNADWNLLLVNAENPLSGDFSVSVRNIAGYDDRRFDARAADALEAMLADAKKDGCQLYLVSAYRSVSRQAALYERKVNWYLAQGYEAQLARSRAAKWVAAPGTSEHNLGLAADIVSATWYGEHDDLTAEFDATPEYAWLSAHCADYGFVLRYPADKTALTGVSYEPWHYRYVGREAAQYLTGQGLCMEELAKN